MNKIIPFRPRQRAVNPNDIDHVEVWAGISKEWQAPIYGVDYVLGDGSHASMGWWPDLARAMAQARELAAWGPYPIREGEP